MMMMMMMMMMEKRIVTGPSWAFGALSIVLL